MQKLAYRSITTNASPETQAYNGVFISDVVGLGKTYRAMLANTLNAELPTSWRLSPVLVGLPLEASAGVERAVCGDLISPENRQRD